MSSTVLIVTEKPSIARAFVRSFSIVYKLKFKSEKGQSKYNRIFRSFLKDEDRIDFKIINRNYSLKPDDEVIITSVLGHMYSFDYPPPFDKESTWQNTDPIDLLRQKPIDKAINDHVIEQIKSLSNDTTVITIGTDWDGHGESIGRQILNTVVSINSKVKHGRMRFTSINPHSIKKAFEEQHEIDWDLANQIDSLRKQDLRMGASLTRFLTVGVQNYSNIRNQVISYGPVQSPILYIIAKRFLEVEQFKTEKFWKLIARINFNGKFVFFDWKGNPTDNEKFVDKLIAKFNLSNGIITDSQEYESSIKRPLPLDTDNLEAECSRIFRTSPKSIADVSEQLYNLGFITYPRTESSYYHEKDLTKLVEKFSENLDYGDIAKECIKIGGSKNPTKGRYTKDHEPIKPIKSATQQEIEKAFARTPRFKQLAWKVYSYIVLRFLATVHEDTVTMKTLLQLKITEEEFVAEGERIMKKGFLNFYPYKNVIEKELVPLEMNSKWQVELIKHQGFTTPPSIFTESQLIRIMSELNIGTDATRSTHINTVQKRNYAKINGMKRELIPTPLGKAFYQVLTSNAKDLILPEIRGKVEQWTNDIREHQRTGEEVDELVVNLTTQGIQNLKSNEEEIFKSLIDGVMNSTGEGSVMGSCSECESDLILRFGKKNSRFLRCSNNLCEKTFPLPKKGEIEVNEVEYCRICGNHPFIMTTNTRKWVLCPICWTNEAKSEKEPWFCSECDRASCPFSKNYQKTVKAEILGSCPKCNGDVHFSISEEKKTVITCKSCSKKFKAPNPKFNTVVEPSTDCKECGRKTLIIRKLGKKPYRLCIFCGLFYFD